MSALASRIQVDLSEGEIERLRRHAVALSMKTRLVGDTRAQTAYEIAEAFLALTEPDPRRANIEPSIQTASGKFFNFTRPQDFDWNIDDVAHGLAHQCRFGGHSLHFYPIAQHSVHASEQVDPEFAFEALLHDAHESFYLDLMTPLKILLPDYRRLEKSGEKVMRWAYGLTERMPSLVKQVDIRMLATERRDMMAESGDFWEMLTGIEPFSAKISPWTPATAKIRFIERFWTLWPAHVAGIRAELAVKPRSLPGIMLPPGAFDRQAASGVFEAPMYYSENCPAPLYDTPCGYIPNQNYPETDDHTIEDCKSRFINLDAFRGVPKIPDTSAPLSR